MLAAAGSSVNRLPSPSTADRRRCALPASERGRYQRPASNPGKVRPPCGSRVRSLFPQLVAARLVVSPSLSRQHINTMRTTIPLAVHPARQACPLSADFHALRAHHAAGHHPGKMPFRWRRRSARCRSTDSNISASQIKTPDGHLAAQLSFRLFVATVTSQMMRRPTALSMLPWQAMLSSSGMEHQRHNFAVPLARVGRHQHGRGAAKSTVRRHAPRIPDPADLLA